MYLTAALLVATADFFYLVILRSLSGNGAAGGDVPHTILVLIAASTAFMGLARAQGTDEEQKPIQTIWRVMVTVTLSLLLVGLLQLTSLLRFSTTEHVVTPATYASLVASAALAIFLTVGAMLMFISLARLIFVKRRKTTRRNFISFLVVMTLYLLVHYLSSPNGASMRSLETLANVLFGLTTVAILINSFRFSWILILNRREKLLHLVLSLFGFLFFLILTIYATGDDNLSSALLFYHPLVAGLTTVTYLFGTVYMGIGFTSTLLHLPTAKEFDRKKTEISSLQNLSRLTTQVFDFDELVATTTQLALGVSESDAAWLELVRNNGSESSDVGISHRRETPTSILTNSLRNITVEQIDTLKLADGTRLQRLAIETEKPVLIQDIAEDRRVHPSTRDTKIIGTLAMVPLSSRGEIIGLLCVTKRNPYEYDKDVLNILYAFADIVSVAIENNRLIRESFVKERMEQELLVAQQMQQSLLPQDLPASASFEIAARSIPAYEVGGDYYDLLQLDEHRLGIVIGDVSGKGVSAALYMAQLKGVFQSFSRHDLSARDILIRMNAALCKSMERRSFISLLYAILDTASGVLTFSRAGHCPLLYEHGSESRFLQPTGMALGLDGSERFADSLEEERLQLENGDVIVMYTDGVTEARNAQDVEFEYARLAEVVQERRSESAQSILASILGEVRKHSSRERAEDDMTVVVLRWTEQFDMGSDSK